MSSQAAVAANREKRTPARAHAASLPPWSVGAVEGEAVGAVEGEAVGAVEGEAVGAVEGEAVGAVEGEAVGAHVSVTPHEVASQPAPKNASSRDQGGSDLTVHQPRVWLKEEAFWNMPGILRSAPVSHSPMGWLKAEARKNMNAIFSTAPVSHSPMGLRGRCLDGRRAERLY